MAQELIVTGSVTNTSSPRQQGHGDISVPLTVGDFEKGDRIDVTDTPEVTVAIPAEFLSNGVLSLIDDTDDTLVVTGEFVQYGFATGVYIGKLTPGVPAVLELNASVASLFMIRNAVGTSKVRYHMIDGG